MVEKEIAAPFKTGHFQAMSCPCEILLDTAEVSIAAEQLAAAVQEARRIENKFSRYVDGNMVYAINQSRGKKVRVDDETAALLDYAAECYAISGGLFDITAGAVRKGPNTGHVGWNRVTWRRPYIELPAEFEIDFGGIGKEYAADKILSLLTTRHPLSTLVNLGGDIAVSGDRLWSVGIEDPSRPGEIVRTIHLRQGGVATSGGAKRPGHIVNPKTGRPVSSAPRSITVAAKTCTEAGFWSTLGILKGGAAEAFLKKQSLEFWCS